MLRGTNTQSISEVNLETKLTFSQTNKLLIDLEDLLFNVIQTIKNSQISDGSKEKVLKKLLLVLDAVKRQMETTMDLIYDRQSLQEARKISSSIKNLSTQIRKVVEKVGYSKYDYLGDLKFFAKRSREKEETKKNTESPYHDLITELLNFNDQILDFSVTLKILISRL